MSDFDTPTIVEKPNGEFEAHFQDRSVNVTFYNERELMEHQSKVDGEEVYREVPHIRIEFPGDRNKVVVRPILPDDSRRFPREFARFQNGDTRLIGTLISNWDGISDADARALSNSGVMTIEQLAGIPDGALDGLGLGARLFRERARRWVATHSVASDSATQALQERLDRAEAFIAMMQEREMASAAEPDAKPARKAA